MTVCIQGCVVGMDNWGECAGSPLCNVTDKETTQWAKSLEANGLFYLNLTLYRFRATITFTNSVPTCYTILYIVAQFSNMFRPDLIGHPQGVL